MMFNNKLTNNLAIIIHKILLPKYRLPVNIFIYYHV